MRKRIKFLVLAGLLIQISGCQQYQIPRELPVRDIIFQVGYPSDEMTGFVNIDGSGLEIITSHNYVRKPGWSTDGSILFGLVNSDSPSPEATRGAAAYWTEQEGLHICEDLSRYVQIESTLNPTNPYEVIVNDSKSIMFLDMSTCTITSTIIQLHSEKWCDVLGISYSWDRDELVYGVGSCWDISPKVYQLIRLDVATGSEAILGEGVYPHWSPDSTQIAYVGIDGIYLMDSDGSNLRQLLSHTFVGYQNSIAVLAPNPRWTPDGEWLLYHHCGQYDCLVSDNSIYRLSLLSGQEEKIVDGGAFPAWRP